MKNLFWVTLICFFSLMSISVQADEQEKNFSIGLGSYVLNLAYDDPAMGEDDEFSGGAVSLTFAVTDNFAVKGALYSMEHNDFSDTEASGLDLTVQGGTGMATNGFKIYGGIGLFNETIETSLREDDFSGLQFVGGLGYNWSVIAIDLSVGVRDASDYEDFFEQFGGTVTVTAVTAAFTVSVRF
jgi:hypothetical protein